MIDYQKVNDKLLAEYKSEAAKNHEEFIADGLMFCGKVVDKGGYWERIRGNESELYDKMSPKILLLTKDFPDDGGTEDIRIENFRINGKVEPETSGRRFHQNVMAHVWGLTHYMQDKGTKVSHLPFYGLLQIIASCNILIDSLLTFCK